MNIINYCINLKLEYYNNYNSKYKTNINKLNLFDSYYFLFSFTEPYEYIFYENLSKKGNNYFL